MYSQSTNIHELDKGITPMDGIRFGTM